KGVISFGRTLGGGPTLIVSELRAERTHMAELPRYHVHDIEHEMDIVVTKCGGERIEAPVANGSAPNAADYLFRHFGVIAELKCMENDTREEGPFKEKVSEMYWRWVRE